MQLPSKAEQYQFWGLLHETYHSDSSGWVFALSECPREAQCLNHSVLADRDCVAVRHTIISTLNLTGSKLLSSCFSNSLVMMWDYTVPYY